MSAQPRRPRTLTLLAAYVLAGATLNTLVAWTCARWASDRPSTWTTEQVWTASLPTGADAYVNDPSYLAMFGSGRDTGLDRLTSRSLVCTRIEYKRWHDNRYLAYSRSHEIIAFGFPWAAMAREERSSFDTAALPEFGFSRVPGARGGWPITYSHEANGFFYSGPRRPDHIYPLIPIPLGFTANTLLYAAVLFTFTLAPRLYIRHSRRRRNLCQRCAYPIGPSPLCTECGHLRA